MRYSRLRTAVSLQLAKAYKLGLPMPVGRLVRVFNLNSGLVYRYLSELEDEGLVERVKRGLYRVKNTEKAEAWITFLLSSLEPGLYGELRLLPEVYYYLAEPPSIEWLGFPDRILVMIDEALKGRINLPEKYNLVYVKMRGRKWRYDWDLRVSKATLEQALADILSYDPDYPVEQYILLNMERIDLDDVARRTTPSGIRRLSTFISYLRLATGKPIPAGFDYISLTDPETLEAKLSEYTQLVYANGVDARRGI